MVILNDNEMSIAPNVGSIASYLSVLRSKPFANFVRRTGKDMLKRIPLGGAAKRAIEGAEIGAMHFIGPSEKTAVIFEELGFRYIGPIDGHNYDVVLDALQTAIDIDRPVLLHVRTVKGKGYEPAERDSRTFHGIGANAFEPSNGARKSSSGARPKFQDAFGDAMIAVAEKDPRVVGITAAMPDGTGLAKFGKRFPERYFDVGIAEAHAVCFAAGLATNGLKPVCAIYSTFLQRAYDQIVHDVVVQNLPVVFCMDRAGFVGDDGPTHMGLYDIAYLRTLPNMTLMAPQHGSRAIADARTRALAQLAGGYPLSARLDKWPARPRAGTDRARQGRGAAARPRPGDPRLRDHARHGIRRERRGYNDSQCAIRETAG